MTGVGLAPVAHALDVGGPFEIVAPLGRSAPAGLAGGLAGRAARRQSAEALVEVVARIRLVQLVQWWHLRCRRRVMVAPVLEPMMHAPLDAAQKKTEREENKNGGRR